ARTVWGGVRIVYAPQEPVLDDALTVLDTVFQSDAPLMRLLRDYEQASLRLQQSPHDAQLQEKLTQLTGEMDRTNGWTAETEAKTILTKLGVAEFEAQVGTLSGGQRKRVALASALIAPADLLILDEPTNHIDADAVSWLENYLTTRAGALLMVTHDRYFLERIANRIVELDRRKLASYGGNYGRYLEKRTQRHEQLAAAEVKRQAALRRELEWLRRGAMARSTKQKARKQRIAEMQTIRYDSGQQRVAMSLAGRRLGKRVLEARDLSKAYDSLSLFQQLDFDLAPGDRIGVIGPNGTGKSTFLDVLAGKTAPDSGTVAWGETVHLGYYDQLSEGLPEEMRVLEYIESAAPLIRAKDGERVTAGQMLRWFLFTDKEQRTRIRSLSGGERRRLYLLRTLIHQPNVLFLDEPTNDLDVQTLTVLEEFLDRFKGCLVVVSHDRYFLDRNVDFLMSFEDGVLGARFPTPYDTYRKRLEEGRRTAVTPSTSPKKTRQKPPQPRRLTWKEKQEFASLETKIGELEAEKARLEDEINQVGSDYGRLQTLAAALEQTKDDLDTAEFRWLELSEIAENNG
ncbi:MAG: ABC-F family ATP-binding cassette domain-containing protein, partial [Chloroflexi bacterium]|nr:ABC-F family ATP-binding cassette domain-containing protein [Chloroflexota bacterium]